MNKEVYSVNISATVRNEIEQDTASRFVAEQYISRGYHLHFHRNIEIYGVVKGTVCVRIAGERCMLTDGQIAVIDGLENHSYEIDGSAEIFYFHIGTAYCNLLYSMYPHKRLPYFLMDVESNKKIYAVIRSVMKDSASMSELRRYGLACQLFADIIDCYGVVEKASNTGESNEVATKVVQYIYEHYNEHITLESLSKVFFISPKALSKKIRKRLNMDLRLFVNNIRIQQAVLMRGDPAYADKSLEDIAGLCGFTNMGTFYRSYERNFKLRKLEKD